MNPSTPPRRSSTAMRSGADRGTRPFAALPHDIAGRPDVTPTDKAVLLALLFWARDKAVCWPSDASIGSRIGRCPGTVQRALRRLESLGLIERRRADNVTGRELVLVWRRRATPEAPALSPPTPPAREEGEKEENTRRPRPGPAQGPAAAETGAEEPSLEDLRRWATGRDPVLRQIGLAALAERGASGPVHAPAGAAPAHEYVDRLAGDAQVAPLQPDRKQESLAVPLAAAEAAGHFDGVSAAGPALGVDRQAARRHGGVVSREPQQPGGLLEDRQKLVGGNGTRHGARAPGPGGEGGPGKIPDRGRRVSAGRGARPPWVEALARQIGVSAAMGG